ncbi:hypothetical protein [Rubrobacter indicoceani]|uniref:hypothetical protein n=1 Tax=Rubrobacter indicoceani TaxID=2051957 RepID=UPI000E5A6B64|nr:hypothetical protein [Rubrobacter indicoceani]
MSEEIKVGDWVSFKSSGFKNEGKVTKVEEGSYRVEIPSDGSGVYVDVPKGPKVSKVDPPAGS